MAIVSANLDNVYRSLDAYLTANLLFADGSAVSLRKHGVRRFVPPAYDPWVEAHYDFLGLQNAFRNRLGITTGAGTAVLATERYGYLQLNCYQRARSFSTRYTTATIRDLVVGSFPEGELVPVLDFTETSGPPTMAPEGWIVVDGVKEHVQDMGINTGVVQHIIQVETRYLELYTRSA